MIMNLGKVKKLIALALVVFISCLGLLGCSSTNFSDGSDSRIENLKNMFEQPHNGKVMVAAHRGCWTITPENTIASLDYCVELGVEVIEIDVQLTADKKLIVFHDRTLERMTNGSGYVAEHTLEDLKELSLYERDGSPAQLLNKRIITNIKIPTLEEFLDAANGRILINLEIKSNKFFSFEDVFYAATKMAKNRAVEDQIIWKIPSPSRVYDVKIIGDFSGDDNAETKSSAFVSRLDLEGLTYVMPIINNSERSFTKKLTDYENLIKIDSFELITTELGYWQLNNGKIVDADKNSYMAIALKPSWAGGLSDDVALKDPDSSWGRLTDLGFKIIMTDRPEQLIAYLRRKGLKN